VRNNETKPLGAYSAATQKIPAKSLRAIKISNDFKHIALLTSDDIYFKINLFSG